jgi:predicted RecA/RadA family phage recombinase
VSTNKIYNKSNTYDCIVYTPDTEASGWAGITKGDVAVIGNVLTIAVKDFDENRDTSITLITRTDIALGTKTAGTGTAITAGSNVYVTSTGLITTTSGGNKLCGICRKDASDADTTIEMTFDGQLYNLD